MVPASPPAPRSRLHVVYRSHGGENRKGRPSYYGKLLALASVGRAATCATESTELVFANDGPIPPDRLALMSRYGRIIEVDGGNNRRSYRSTLSWAARQAWPAQDVVLFAEDDYLYTEASLQHLTKASNTMDADLFALHGSKPIDPGSPRRRPAGQSLESLPGSLTIEVDGVVWYPEMSTTSTFGIRAGVLRKDLRLLRVLPYTGGAFDHTTCLTLQGFQPFPWTGIARDAMPLGRDEPPGWPRSAARALVRVGFNLRSKRRAGQRRRLMGSSPELVHHMELEAVPDDPRWAELAADVRRWAANQGIGLPSTHG